MARAQKTPASSCDPQVIFKVTNFQAFLKAIATCGTDDFKSAIDNANAAPIDNAALACLQPVQTLVAGIVSQQGLVTKFQLYRRAKMQGFLSACITYVNSTVALQ